MDIHPQLEAGPRVHATHRNGLAELVCEICNALARFPGDGFDDMSAFLRQHRACATTRPMQ